MVVLPANIADREAAPVLLEGIRANFPTLSIIWADQGYVGQRLARWIAEKVGCQIIITNRVGSGAWLAPGEKQPPPKQPSRIEPRRWVVERTIAWEGRNRRLSKDYEGLPETEEAICYLGMVALMLKRLAP